MHVARLTEFMLSFTNRFPRVFMQIAVHNFKVLDIICFISVKARIVNVLVIAMGFITLILQNRMNLFFN